MKLRVKNICKEKGMTLMELAEKLKITREALSRSITGNITLNRLEEIAGILNVAPLDLIEDEREFQGHITKNGKVYSISSRADIEKLLK